MLDRWQFTTADEELMILQQFVRFGETKSIAQELMLADTLSPRPRQAPPGSTADAPSSTVTTSTSTPVSASTETTDIKRFIERGVAAVSATGGGSQTLVKGLDAAAQHLLSRTLVYPHLATAGLARLLGPTLLHNLASAGVTSRSVPLVAAAPTTQAPTPGVAQTAELRSPLRSLQTMEPFDYRKDGGAGASPKPNQVAWDARSLVNFPRGGVAYIPGTMIAVKTETEERGADGAINYSTKDRAPASTGGPNIAGTTMPTVVVGVAPPGTAASGTGLLNSSAFAHQKLRSLRKSVNPMKRPWQPTPGYGGTLISPAGKKRVLCTACHKTFCDKGALKIHYR